MVKKIVLADDNRTFLMHIGLLLKRLGFQLLIATNGVEALSLLKSETADLVILEVHMDTLDGITTLRHIKSGDLTSHLPVIMISADKTPKTIKACRDHGCIDYLLKPVNVDRLHQSIQNAFFAQGGYGRKHIRTGCNKKVVVQYDGKQHHLFTEMIGEGGMYVRTENPFPVGSAVVVSLQLEGEKQRQYTGKIIYTKKEFGDFSKMSPGMAIQFMNLSPQDSNELHDFLKTLLTGDIIEEVGDRKILEA